MDGSDHPPLLLAREASGNDPGNFTSICSIKNSETQTSEVQTVLHSDSRAHFPLLSCKFRSLQLFFLFNRAVMVDDGFVEGELVIDWDHLFENIPDDLNFDFGGLPAADGVSTSPDSGLSFSIDDIEQYLMSDDCNHAEEKDQEIIVDGFLSEVLLDLSPGPGSDRSKDSSPSPELVEVETDQEGKMKTSPVRSPWRLTQTKR
ncbi:UNVERIFIED_CONTAM: hypothetical protein Sangu_2467600 [Sesamum angustifolium]|uniref:Uncharacterized protein n=1 Tax=Sesamum angustifolium TaxID=2727405 RepID=A0AAW2J189_9LAMI